MQAPDSEGACVLELLAVVEAHARPDALQWLRRGLPAAGAPFARGAFFGFYAGAERRFRVPLLALPADQRARLVACGIAVPEAFSLPDFVRAVLLLRATGAAPASQHVAITTEAFRRGDNAERVALLRALPLLPEPARFVELAVEACRTHVLDVFAAIACDNPFPARHFAELNFNQLVIKALFVELSLARVIGWRDRANPELRRIAADYEAERRAAGRSVPSDIQSIRATEPRQTP
jgi:hypothetical protein